MRQAAIALLLAIAWPALARAELSVFLLTTGGQLIGELVNVNEAPRTKYVVKTDLGGEVTLDRQQVKEVVHRRPAEIEYEKIRPQYPNTAEGQWSLAEWCREQALNDLRQKHLRRVVELDANHVEARRALGFTSVEGAWKTQQQIMTERGYVEYKGRWRLKQEVEILEQTRKNELAEKAWFNNVRRWREWLDTDKRAEGQKNLLEIRDPLALSALRKHLENERNEAVRVLLVEAVARTGAAALQILANRSLEDPSQEVRLTCLDFLDDAPHPDIVSLYIQKLRDKNNVIVNRAAVGLQRLKDPTAITPLVDALVTTHTFQIASGTPQGQYTTSFGPNGSSFGTGGAAPRVIQQQMNNGAVLDALTSLTAGVNFNYDVPTWRKWLATQRKSMPLDARRS